MPGSVASPTPWHSKYHQRASSSLPHDGALSNTNKQQQLNANIKKVTKTTTQEDDLLQVAQNEGFLHALTEDELLENSQDIENKKASYPGNAYLLILGFRRLRNISLLDLCERLEICILSNNFIDSIEPLKWCQNLNYLDVHSNQVYCMYCYKT